MASLPQVGNAFWKPSAKQELDNIGSEPAQDHVFRVDNFAALSSIQEQLQEKIFALEGKGRVRLGLGIERFQTPLSSQFCGSIPSHSSPKIVPQT